MRDKAEHQIGSERLRIDFPGREIRIQERRQFGREDQAVVCFEVLQRLFPETIARQEKRLLARVPQCESKHAAQKFEQVRAVLFVKMNERLGVALRSQLVAALFQIGAQFYVIVNLTVEDDVNGSVFVGNRLMTAGHIDDAQSPRG